MNKSGVLLLLITTTASCVTFNENVLDIGAGESLSLSGTHLFYERVRIHDGGELNVIDYNRSTETGQLILISPTIEILEGSSINASGSGYRSGASFGSYTDGEGPGGGAGTPSSAGGGGYGGKGGDGSESAAALGGEPYGTFSLPIVEMGSGGGSQSTEQGGDGGGKLILISDRFTLTGSLLSAGEQTGVHYNGAGSGGGILLLANTGNATGTISVNGGPTGSSEGGGGGGGRIKSSFSLLSALIHVSAGGSGIQAGDAGSVSTDIAFSTYADYANPSDFNGYPEFGDFNGNGKIDFFEDSNQDLVPDGFEDLNSNDFPDVFEDFNGNGTPDGFEDFDENGKPDAFEADFNVNGIPDVFEFGVLDGFFEDGDGDGIAGGEEIARGVTSPDNPDSDGDNVSDGPLDPDGDGPIQAGPDSFDGVVISSSSHPLPPIFLNDSSPSLSWVEPMAGLLGYLWSIDPTPGEVQFGDGTFTAGLSVDNPASPEGLNWFNITPVDANSDPLPTFGSYPLRVNSTPPVVFSPTHPDPDEIYPDNTILFQWDTVDFPTYYYVFDQSPDTRPTIADPSTTSKQVVVPSVGPGIHYLHVISEDSLGNLSPDTGNFMVRIAETHHADADDDFRMTIAEAADELQCWLEEQCGIEQAALALSLWLNGECYEGSGSEFINIACPVKRTLFPKGTSVQAERVLPTCYLPGESFGVTVELAFGGSPPSVVLVEEEPPPGWTANAISNGGTFSNGKVRWSFIEGLGTFPPPAQLSYQVVPPQDASTTVSFQGTIASPDAAAIGGDLDLPITFPGVEVSRNLPDCYSLDTGVPVSLSLMFPSPAPSVVLIEETIPADWVVDGTSDGGIFSGGKIRWSLFSATEENDIPASISYQLVPPNDARGEVLFSGIVAIPEVCGILGEDSISAPCVTQTPSESPTPSMTPTITPTPTPTITPTPSPTSDESVVGDTNGDGKVDHSDLLLILENWHIHLEGG